MTSSQPDHSMSTGREGFLNANDEDVPLEKFSSLAGIHKAILKYIK